MIVESLLDLFALLFQTALSGIEILTLPLDLMNFLQDILCYGIWVVGADMMALIIASVLGWWTVKATVGLVIFIWKLLPLT